MSDFKNNTIVVKFDNNKVPEFKEPKSSNKLKFVKYGDQNDYPEFLVTLFNRSAKHNAISTSKQLYIKGQGVTFSQDGMQGDDVAKLQAFIDNPNPYESLDEILNKVGLDEILFGGFYLYGVNDATGNLVELYHVDYTKIRSNSDNTEFYKSDCWLNEDGSERTNFKEGEITTIPGIDTSKKQKEFIYYFKSYRPNIKTYTLPEYIGAVPAIITDAEIANFHRAEIQNGFKGSRMIVFKNGVPSDEEMKSVEKRMKNKFTPTDAAGSMVIDFVDDPNRVPEVIALNGDDFDKRYDALNKTIQEEIFVGHKVTSPMLFGVRTEGQLGGRAEMVDAFNLFQNTYITPKQLNIEFVFNMFAPVKGKIKIKPIEPIMPSFSENILTQILTKDELREIIGRKPIDVAITKTQTNDAINALSPLVANKVLAKMTDNEVRGLAALPRIEGGDKLPTDAGETPSPTGFRKFAKQSDKIDFEVFSRYGEKIENFSSIGMKRTVFSRQDFALNKIEQGVLDLIKNSPKITVEDLAKVMKSDLTDIRKALENLTAEGMIEEKKGNWTLTDKALKQNLPTFEDLFIRYRYVLRPDAPALVAGGESREFCKSMIESPRYFSKEDIENISRDLGAIYGVADYDAFKMRGGWYHDPQKDVNLPFCRHIWISELVKRVRN
jgi:hypothetical protein